MDKQQTWNSATAPRRSRWTHVLTAVTLCYGLGLGFSAGKQFADDLQHNDRVSQVRAFNHQMQLVARPADIVPTLNLPRTSVSASDAGIVKITAYQLEHQGNASSTQLIAGTGVVVGRLRGARAIPSWALVLTAHHVVADDASIVVRSASQPNIEDVGTPFDGDLARSHATVEGDASDTDGLVDAALVAVPIPPDARDAFAVRSLAANTLQGEPVALPGFHGKPFDSSTPLIKQARLESGTYYDSLFRRAPRALYAHPLSQWAICPACGKGDSGAPFLDRHGRVVGILVRSGSGRPVRGLEVYVSVPAICRLLRTVRGAQLPADTTRTCAKYPPTVPSVSAL